MSYYQVMASRIPAGIRKTILEEGFIDKAKNVEVRDSPMEFLFDVYEEFIDANGEHEDFCCGRCREEVLKDWRGMKPYLMEMQNQIK